MGPALISAWHSDARRAGPLLSATNTKRLAMAEGNKRNKIGRKTDKIDAETGKGRTA